MKKCKDNLYKLSDAKLSEVFAVEVVGWDKKEYKEDGDEAYATDANTVLPWLAKVNWEAENFIDEGDIGILIFNDEGNECGGALAPTFSRAACVALIRANRFTSSSIKPTCSSAGGASQ